MLHHLLGVVLLLLVFHQGSVQAYSIHKSSRRAFVSSCLSLTLPSVLAPPPAALAEETKQTGLSPGAIADIVREDVVKRQFLASADLTRSIYSESATFQDEIDTYTLPKWIKGTKRLFNADASNVRLVGDVSATDEEVRFRFDEDLQFAIPFKPTVSLTGELVLKRDPATGLITSYKENWDQSVAEVLKTAKF